MRNLKYTAFGAVNIDDVDEHRRMLNDLKVYCRTAAESSTIKTDGNAIIEVLGYCKKMMGNDFNAFLRINYHNGRGRCASLMKEIGRYIAGKTSYRSVQTQLTIRENDIMNLTDNSYAFVHSPSESNSAELPDELKNVTNLDFAKLVAGIGPLKVARLFLMMSGETYNAIRK